MADSSIWSAGRYESVAERIAPIADEVVAAVGSRVPLRDTELVDLACGTGNAALAAAAAGARVTGVDITPELLAIAADKPGAGAVRWVAADASATGLPDAGFAAAVSNMGIIFVEPVAMVAELSRLVRPGGVLGFSTWVRDADNPFFDPIMDVLGSPPPAPYSPDQWGQPEIAEARLGEAFTDVTIENGVHPWRFASVQHAVRFVTAESPMHLAVLGRLEDATRSRLVDAFSAAFAAHAEPGGVVFGASYAVVTAARR
ncbi:class I SAM-dependent methyltransferase [Mycobacterium sp. BMJ-28]